MNTAKCAQATRCNYCVNQSTGSRGNVSMPHKLSPNIWGLLKDISATLMLSAALLLSACSGNQNNVDDLGDISADNTDRVIENGTIDNNTETPIEEVSNISFPPLEPGVWWQPNLSEPLTWDWQIGHLNPQPNLGVDVYNVDIDADPRAIQILRNTGAKLICYFSVGTVENWRSDADRFPAELIGERYEQLPGERWLNYKEIEKLAPIMLDRLDRCAAKGFHAVEADNVDAFNYETRNEAGEVINIGTNFDITEADTVAYVRWLAQAAHERGLSLGLKNAEAIAEEVVDDIDFMVTEECILYDWCDAAKVIVENNKPVFAAEYIDFPGTQSLSYVCQEAAKYGFYASHFNTQLNNGYFTACAN